MGFLGSDSNEVEEKEEEEQKLAAFDIITEAEEPLFSCEDTEENRELALTATHIVVRKEGRGVSMPVDESSIKFASRAGDKYRITVVSHQTGLGIVVNENEFREFWKVLSKVRKKNSSTF